MQCLTLTKQRAVDTGARLWELTWISPSIPRRKVNFCANNRTQFCWHKSSLFVVGWTAFITSKLGAHARVQGSNAICVENHSFDFLPSSICSKSSCFELGQVGDGRNIAQRSRLHSLRQSVFLPTAGETWFCLSTTTVLSALFPCLGTSYWRLVGPTEPPESEFPRDRRGRYETRLSVDPCRSQEARRSQYTRGYDGIVNCDTTSGVCSLCRLHPQTH